MMTTEPTPERGIEAPKQGGSYVTSNAAGAVPARGRWIPEQTAASQPVTAPKAPAAAPTVAPPKAVTSAQTESSASGPWERAKPRVRLIGSLVIAALALLTLGLLNPSSTGPDGAEERAAIWYEDAGNQALTEGAPQQAVVNGWTGNALLDLISEQLDATAVADQRSAVLLTLGVLMLALMAATTPSNRSAASTLSNRQ